MRRVESATQFLEVAVLGRTVRTVTGKRGGRGRERFTRYRSEAAARVAGDTLIEKRTRASYQLVYPPPLAATRTFVAGDRRWDITLDGSQVTTRTSTAAPKSTVHADSGAALAAYTKAIATKLTAGFVEAIAHDRALEQAIARDPYDRAAYSVYADWLQAHGDPRGELAALQLAGKDTAALALLERHAPTLLGPLAAHAVCYDHLYHQPAREAFTWRYGFIHAARMSRTATWVTHFPGDIAHVLAVLLDHPSGRLLCELTLMYGNDHDEDLTALIGAVAARRPPALRKLVIGDAVDQISWYRVGKLGKLWSACPKLEVFELEAGEFELGTIEAPELRRAIIKTGGLTRANGKAIAAAAMPRIEHLEIYVGDSQYGASCKLADLRPLLARADLPQLRRLGVMNAEFADALCGELATARLVRQLSHLDLSHGLMSDDGARTIAAHRAAFAHLDVLDVSHNYLTKSGIAALRGCAKRVVADHQKQLFEDNPDFRYVTIGE